MSRVQFVKATKKKARLAEKISGKNPFDVVPRGIADVSSCFSREDRREFRRLIERIVNSKSQFFVNRDDFSTWFQHGSIVTSGGSRISLSSIWRDAERAKKVHHSVQAESSLLAKLRRTERSAPPPDVALTRKKVADKQGRLEKMKATLVQDLDKILWRLASVARELAI